jgi:pimeloyl-ACP methyl ester carboxylesterase
MKAQSQIEALLLSGPWSHRFVSANGNRFHVAECGEGPLVLFVHGFPDCWWTWREQLPAFAAAGYRAVAMDLRGYGASDKPPRGYDAYTLAADIAGVIRALGERSATLVGHDWGGFLSWSAAAFHPRLVRGLATIGAAHPLLLRRAMLRDRRQIAAFSHMFAFQLPRYEHVLTRAGGAYIKQMVRRWAAPEWGITPACEEYGQACAVAMGTNHAAFCALEYYRWALRSLTRRSGWRFTTLMNQQLRQPMLQIHGELDSCILTQTVADSRRYLEGEYEQHLLPNVGHFPHVEAAEDVTGLLLRWAATHKAETTGP